MAHPENGRKNSVHGHVVKVLKHRRDDRGMVLEPYMSRCVREGEIHELVATDQRDLGPGGVVDRVAFLGFAELTCGGVLDRGDEVWAGDQLVGTVLGYDSCHFPNHYNILIATDDPRTGPELGLEPAVPIRFVPAVGHRIPGEDLPPLLRSVTGPADVRAMDEGQLAQLARDIRDTLVKRAARAGGRPGPGLGAVELAMALHRVFDSPRDHVVWDAGHQTPVHQMLTGRACELDDLGQEGGAPGDASRAGGEHDPVENSHASTALSYADGLAKARQLRGEGDRAVVAVIGGGALTGGMCWEAINSIAGAKDRPVVIVVDDDERSYPPAVGGLAEHLSTLRTSHRYERAMGWGKALAQSTPVVGGPLLEGLHGAKRGLKEMLTPQNPFDGLGLKYVGPVDGHSTGAVEHALRRARHYGGPVLVHVLTGEGAGRPGAEHREADRFRAASVPAAGHPKSPAGDRTWTSVFAEEAVSAGHQRGDLVAITAATPEPTGLREFSRVFPGRTFDAGTAEQHAVASAAGLAAGGLHPVVAMYAASFNRAFDQAVMDIARHGLPVTFVLDHAGLTGDDGAGRGGMWDLSLMQLVPGLRVAVPRDGRRLGELFRESVAVDDGPTAVRFPQGPVPEEIPAVATDSGLDVLHRGEAEDVLIVAVGAMADCCLRTAALLDGKGIGCTVVDPRWIKPVNPALAPLAARHRLVVTVEDNGVTGGAGAALAQALYRAGVDTPVRSFGIPQEFLNHADGTDILKAAGLDCDDIAERTIEALQLLGRRGAAHADGATAPGAAARASA